jgi:hypothetical protein
MGGIPQAHVRICRVLHEDDAFMTVEVPKDLNRQLRLEDGDRFLTLIFCKTEDDGRLRTWIPWENEENGGQE